MRFELTTLTLARLCSTPELRPRPVGGAGDINSKPRLQEGNVFMAGFWRDGLPEGYQFGGVVDDARIARMGAAFCALRCARRARD